MSKKKKSIRRQNDINTKSDTADNKSDEKENIFDSTKKIKEHADRSKAINSPMKTKSRDVKKDTC